MSKKNNTNMYAILTLLFIGGFLFMTLFNNSTKLPESVYEAFEGFVPEVPVIPFAKEISEEIIEHTPQFLEEIIRVVIRYFGLETMYEIVYPFVAGLITSTAATLIISAIVGGIPGLGVIMAGALIGIYALSKIL
jgi:hypothetical protein